MRYLIGLLACNILLACFLAGCSSPLSRSHEHAAAFARLSPGDQQLVRHGHIRPGMSQEAVYIAWGGPDAKVPGGGGKSGLETWVYRQRVTLLEPPNSYDYYGPYHGLDNGWAGRGSLPGYTYGGVGYEEILRYQPHVRSLDSVRLAEFSGGKVDRFKSADGAMTAPHPAAKTVARHANSSSHAHVAAQTGNPHGRHPRVSHATPHVHSSHHSTAHVHSHPPGKNKSRVG